MRKQHTLLLPMLSPIHQSGLVDVALQASGYQVVCLTSEDREAVNVGLRFVNNDACYPAIISIGQLVEALQSGEYDVENTSVLMTQTGGGCRATNYIPLLRKALNDAGFPQVPVVSISMGNTGVESNPGFRFTLPMMKRLAVAFYTGISLNESFIAPVHMSKKQGLSIGSTKNGWKNCQNVRNGSSVSLIAI